MQSNQGLRTFYILTITQVLSMMGSEMTGLAIGIWLYTKTGNATPLVLVPLFYSIPYILFSNIAGALADRMSRRKLIILGDAGQAVPTFLLFLSFLTDHFELWQLYSAVAVQSVFALLQNPAMNASITMLVPEEHRDRANAIREVTSPMARIFAPMLAATLYTAIDVTGVMTIDLVTFVIAVTVVSFLHIPQPARTEEGAAGQGSMWQEIKAGFRFLLDRRPLLIFTIYFTFVNFISTGPFVLMTPYMLALNNNNEKLLGILLTISSVGLVLGGLVTIVWKGTRPRIHTIMMCMIVAAVGLIIFGIVRDPILMAITVFVMMFPYKMSNAMDMSIMQSKIPPDMQGRVYAAMFQLAIFAMPLTYIITGPMVDEVLEPAVGGKHWGLVEPLVGAESGSGMGLFILVCGGIFLVVSLGVYALPSIRHMERDLPDYAAVEEGKKPSFVPEIPEQELVATT